MSVLSTPINQEGGAFDSHVDHISSLVESMGLSPPQANISRQISRSVSSVQTLLVTIEDHGVGVPEQLRDTLFQPFRQTQRMAGGTGKFLSSRIPLFNHNLYYPPYFLLNTNPHISPYTQPLLFSPSYHMFPFSTIHLHLPAIPVGLGLFSLFKRIEALGGDCGVKDRLDGSQGSAIWFSFPYRPDFSWREENALVENFTSLQHLHLYRGGRTHDWDEEQGLVEGQGGQEGQGEWQEYGEEQEEEQGQVQEQGFHQQPQASTQQRSGIVGEGEGGNGFCPTTDHSAHAGQGLGSVPTPVSGLEPSQRATGREGEREVNDVHGRIHEDDLHDTLRMHDPHEMNFTLIPRQITGQSTFDTILPGTATRYTISTLIFYTVSTLIFYTVSTLIISNPFFFPFHFTL